MPTIIVTGEIHGSEIGEVVSDTIVATIIGIV